MKAVQYTRYGAPEVLQLTELAKPTPKDNQVLVKIKATTVTSGDCRLRSSNVPTGFWIFIRLGFGIFGPRTKVLGSEFSGVIEAVGKDVTQYKVGDQVFGATESATGAYAEYVCVAERAAIAIKPTTMNFEEAAGISFGAITALRFLRDFGKIQAGQKVLINGASGAVGTYAVQLARYFGAEVTAVCSAGNAELVRSLGAHHVIDYHKEDFAKIGKKYDIIFDAVGNISFSHCKPALTTDGKLLAVAAGLPGFLLMLWTSMVGRKKVIGGVATPTAQDLAYTKGLIEAGELRSVIDKRYPLEQIAQAHRYVDTGRKKGNVVIQVGA